MNFGSKVILGGQRIGSTAAPTAAASAAAAPARAGSTVPPLSPSVVALSGELAGTSAAATVEREPVIVLWAGGTPFSTGADPSTETIVPRGPGDTVLTYTIRRVRFRRAVADSTTPALTVEQSTGSGAFSVAATVGTVALGSGANEASDTSTLATVSSDDKLRLNVGTLGGQDWFVSCELERQGY